MKTEQHHEAEQLFFQNNLSKTEIAEKLNINRRTVTLWAQQGNWDKIRKSSQHMPSILAEKCYHLLDHYLSHLMTEGATFSTFTLKHAQTIHLLTNSIKRLKNRNTTNETMEMFNFFLPGLQRRDPKLAADLVPYVEEFINTRASVETSDFMPQGFNPDGYIPFPEKEIQETHRDERDTQSLADAFEEFVRTQPTTPPPTTHQSQPDNQQPAAQLSHYAAQQPTEHHPAAEQTPNTDTALIPYPNRYPAPSLSAPNFAHSLTSAPALSLSAPNFAPALSLSAPNFAHSLTSAPALSLSAPNFAPTCSSQTPPSFPLPAPSLSALSFDPIPNYKFLIPNQRAA